MAVYSPESAHQPAWWGRPIDQLGLSHMMTIVLKHAGINKCEDFLGWSEAELLAWATENSVNLSPILRSLANEGISLAPNERPDRLVRLILAPTNHASREAAIDYYGLLGRKPRSLQEMGARDLTKKRLLEQRLSQATPRLSTLSRLAPRLAVAINEAASTGLRAPENLALAIAPLLSHGETHPLHFARLLLDVVNSTAGSAGTRPRQESGAAQVTPASHGVRVRTSVLADEETASPPWMGAPIEHLGLASSATRLLKQTGVSHCHDFTSWTKEELEFWADANRLKVSPLMKAIERHAIPLASSDRPDRLIRLLLAPLDEFERQAVIKYWGLCDPAPDSVQDLADIYRWSHERDVWDRARGRLQRLKQLPPALEPLMLAAAAHLKSGPQKLAAAITPLLGNGQTVPLHLAHLLLKIVDRMMGILPARPAVVPQRGLDRTKQEPVRTASTAHVGGQRAERTRAATDLIDLLFDQEED